MPAERTALVRYVYVDVVSFSLDRTVEAQTFIMLSLARLVQLSVASLRLDPSGVMYLPTGDGMCVCLVDQTEPYDADIRIALSVIEQVHALSLVEADVEKRFAVRVGLNENHDNLLLDIAGRVNVVGLGINMAHRVMSIAAASQLYLGAAVHARLVQRERYRSFLFPVDAIVKHGERLQCYGFCDLTMPCFAEAARVDGRRATEDRRACGAAADRRVMRERRLAADRRVKQRRRPRLIASGRRVVRLPMTERDQDRPRESTRGCSFEV